MRKKAAFLLFLLVFVLVLPATANSPDLATNHETPVLAAPQN